MSSGTGGDYWKDKALPSVFKLVIGEACGSTVTGTLVMMSRTCWAMTDLPSLLPAVPFTASLAEYPMRKAPHMFNRCSRPRGAMRPGHSNGAGGAQHREIDRIHGARAALIGASRSANRTRRPRA